MQDDAERVGRELQQKPTHVKVDHVTHRLLIGCDCGRVISLPKDGQASETCPCGVCWAFDGHMIAQFVQVFVGQGDGRC